MKWINDGVYFDDGTEVPMVQMYETRYGNVRIDRQLARSLKFHTTFSEYAKAAIERLSKSLWEQGCTLKEVRHGN